MHDIPSTIAGIGTALLGGLGITALFKGGRAAIGTVGGFLLRNLLRGGLRIAPWAAGLETFLHSDPLNQGEDEAVKKFLKEREGKGTYEAPGAELIPKSDLQGPRIKDPLGIRYNNPLNMRRAGHEIRYPSAMQGYVAAARNLITYAGRGWDTIESIIKNWTRGDPAGIQKSYMQFLSKRLGVGIGEHLRLSDPETMRRVMESMELFENQRYNPYPADLALNASKYALGHSPGFKSPPNSVTLNNKVDIHISGSKDPAATGRAVAGEQRRVNADAIRHLSNPLAPQPAGGR